MADDIPTLDSLIRDGDSKVERMIKWYSYHAIKRSGLWGFLGFVIPIFLALFTFAAFPLKLDTGGGGWYPRASSYARMLDGVSAAEEVTVFNPLRVDPVARVQLQQSQLTDTLVIYYWDKDGDLITEAGLAEIRELEESIYNLPEYNATCWRVNGECARANSLTQWAYAEQNPDCPSRYIANGQGTTMISDLKQSLIRGVNSTTTPLFCSSGNCSESTCHQYGDTLDKYVTKRYVQADMNTDISKSFISFGMPLAGYDNVTDREDEQLDKIAATARTIRDKFLEKSYSEFDVRYLHGALIGDYFNSLIFTDVINVVISIILVWVYIWYHTKSMFLSGFGLGHVVLSFPFAYLFMCIFLQSYTMGVLNFMSLFIILGIGADDVFIFLDAWKQSQHMVAVTKGATPFHLLHARLCWAYRRASWAMLITSLTTSAAFLMNLASSVPAIQVFGFFTAFMVLTNYLMVISYFPAMVMFYEKFIKDRVCGCWHPCFEVDKWKQPCESSKCCAYGKNAPVQENIELEKAAEEKSEGPRSIEDNIDDYRWIERFLYQRYGVAVYNKRWFIVVFFLGLTILCGVFAAQIESSDKPAQWLPANNPIQQAIDFEQNDFAKTEWARQWFVVHGIDEVERKGTNKYDPDDIGSARYRTFDLTLDIRSQQTFIDQCDEIRTWQNIQVSNNITDMICPMEDFRDYVVDVLNETFPVPTTQVVEKMANFVQWFEDENEVHSPDYSRMKNFDDRSGRRQQTAEMTQLIRFAKNGTDGTLDLKGMLVVVNTTIGSWPADRTQPIHDYFERQIGTLPLVNGLIKPKQMATEWTEMELELTLNRSVYFGMGVSLAIAFVVIVITTNDVLLSLMSVFTIGGIVVSLMATIVWMGWTISVVESICLTILVGLSVDYTIHLANSWRESSEKDRKRRVQETLLEIGISILSAAMTSVLACLPLLNTTIVFFSKFGIFIALTVVWSTLFSFGLFVALLAIGGPRDGRNDFVYGYRVVTCKPSKPSKPDPSDSSADKNESDPQIENAEPSIQKITQI
eukprot:m.33974 g.33974  ORF g.33974 m.33974 type:complete len:1031 (+) comp16909_c0_seq1:328-3420(+)